MVRRSYLDGTLRLGASDNPFTMGNLQAATFRLGRSSFRTYGRLRPATKHAKQTAFLFVTRPDSGKISA